MKFSNVIEFVACRIASSIAGNIWSPLTSVSMRLPSVIGAPSDCAMSSAKARVTPAPGGGAFSRGPGSVEHPQRSSAPTPATATVLSHAISRSVASTIVRLLHAQSETAADAFAILHVEKLDRIEIIREHATMIRIQGEKQCAARLVLGFNHASISHPHFICLRRVNVRHIRLAQKVGQRMF